MKTRNLPIIFTLLFITIGHSQIKKSDLEGTWKLTKTESDAEIIEEDILGNPIKKEDKKIANITIQFGEKWDLDIIQYGEKSRVKYSLKDSLLFLGSNKYKILKLTNNLLVLTDPEGLFSAKDFYSKTNKKIEPVKELELVEKRYDNGQIKVKGTLRNGIENGTWTEWYENGQKKNERIFLNGIPLGTWKEWDKKGKLIREKKWN